MSLSSRPLAIAVAAILAAIAIPAHAQKVQPVEGEGGNSVLEFSSQNEQMNAAIAEARSTLPQFITLLRDPPEGTHTFRFKFPLGGYEHIWVRDIRLENGALHGVLANSPVQPGWQVGDAVEVPFADVSDWAYSDAEGYTHGAYTIRVMLQFVQPEQRAQIEEYYGW